MIFDYNIHIIAKYLTTHQIYKPQLYKLLSLVIYLNTL